ncbi:MAG: transposase, partial [SAR324 cluster bacterium]|nr:transposase [SAR324 cluster bacterium]
ALWTFVEQEGVEPTNNIAERFLRPYVLWRKKSFGTQSERGNRFVERMMTVSMSCRQQSLPVIPFITQALAAHFGSKNYPSLIPQNDDIAIKMAS